MKRTLSVAPMMDWTDRHCRYLHRLITKHTLLYTEMITTGALIHGDQKRFLEYNDEEHPVAIQLGGSDPEELAHCARVAEEAGYDEVNLNVGCPSDRVQSGRFGACLMAEPQLVANSVGMMTEAIDIPVTVKTRLGIDNRDSYEELADFIQQVAAAGCETFVLHARKAWLQGLSPRQNREIPPLRYDWVRRIKNDFHGLEIIINGGFTNLEQVKTELAQLDGMMIGRSAYHNPYLLAGADQMLFAENTPPLSRKVVVERMLPYIDRELSRGVYLKHITRHMLGLFHGQPGGRKWRRHLSENAHRTGAGITVVKEALKIVVPD